jgi:hypothetical protein
MGGNQPVPTTSHVELKRTLRLESVNAIPSPFVSPTGQDPPARSPAKLGPAYPTIIFNS